MAKKAKDLIERSYKLQNNGEIFRKFIDYISQRKLGERSKKEYLGVIIIFLEKIDIDLRKIDIAEIESYCKNAIDSDNQKNKVIGRIYEFCEFAKSNGYLLSFDTSLISQLSIKNKALTTKNAPEPLTIEQIIKLRKTLLYDRKPKYRLLLTFELAYVYGLSIEELFQCSNINYHNNGTFIIKGKEYALLPQLTHIIEENPKILDKYSNSTTFKQHFNQIGELIGRDLKWLDIKKTREIYGITCPHCNKRYPNDADCWQLAKMEEEKTNTMWLICYNCAGKKKAGVSNE